MGKALLAGGAGLILAGILIGIGLNLFPFNDIVATWGEQNAFSGVALLQMTAVIAVGIIAFACLLVGAWEAFPLRLVGFAAFFLILTVGCWYGIAALLAGG